MTGGRSVSVGLGTTAKLNLPYRRHVSKCADERSGG